MKDGENMKKTNWGRYGEDEACRYLEKRGYRLKARNFRRLRGEIDLVMEDGSALVFIEVKTRCTMCYGQPREAVTDVKQKRIRRCAVQYLAERETGSRPVRFDVVEVMAGPGGTVRLYHLRNAF
jgi:putative endonuclease